MTSHAPSPGKLRTPNPQTTTMSVLKSAGRGSPAPSPDGVVAGQAPLPSGGSVVGAGLGSAGVGSAGVATSSRSVEGLPASMPMVTAATRTPDAAASGSPSARRRPRRTMRLTSTGRLGGGAAARSRSDRSGDIAGLRVEVVGAEVEVGAQR